MLLRVIIASNLNAMLLQALSAKPGITTGIDLAEPCRQTERMREGPTTGRHEEHPVREYWMNTRSNYPSINGRIASVSREFVRLGHALLKC